ncbi:hypothetical protein MTR67_009007 [Solanum verrucosum]|uniref:Uncharacterized protein n=1 Tax=Solanum verrucosum TaxID=315347 RepID=A0AAF0TD00_SOLVR|nr:hypothetical protein MTR67_009007 [Solanum verrucosum]
MLGMLVWNDEPTSNIEGWDFDDNASWNKLWVVAPPRDIDRILGLSIEGHIIVEYDDRLVFIICQGPHEVLVGSPHIKIQIGERRTDIGEEGSFEVLEMEESPLVLEGMTIVLDDKSWSYQDIRYRLHQLNRDHLDFVDLRRYYFY